MTRGIAHALVLKEGDLFFLCSLSSASMGGGCVLGLKPAAFDHRLRIVRPILPDFLNHLEIRRIRIGSGCADLRFERAPDGRIIVTVLGAEGVDVVVE